MTADRTVDSTTRRRRTIGAAISGISAAAGLALSSCMLAAPSHAVIGAAPVPLHAESVDFPSASGSRIHAWFARGRPGAGAVLLLHGVGSNRTSMLGRAEFLHARGYTVLALDFQGAGESPGRYVTFGARESLDAAAGLTFLHEHVPRERTGVIGVSMGGAASLLGPGPLAANAFILESVYPTIRQAVSDRLGTWLGPLGPVARLFTPTVIRHVGGEIGVAETDLEPITRIGRIRAPLLLMTGTADRYTPLAEAESLYARAPAPKSFWAIPGAGHEDLFAYTPAEYERRVGAFLDRYLRADGAAVARR